MGTYFALADAAAERGEDYQDLGRMREILIDVQSGAANVEEVARVLDHLGKWESRVTELLKAAEEKKESQAVQAKKALGRLGALRSALESFLSAVHK